MLHKQIFNTLQFNKILSGLLLLSFDMLLFTGCKENPYNPADQFKVVTDLKITPVSVDEALMLGDPMEMSFNNGRLVISDYQGDSLIWIVDLQQGAVSKAAPKGVGPKEFQSPVQLIVKDSVIVLHNRWRYSAAYCKISSDNQIRQISDQFRLPAGVDMIMPIDNNRYISSGIFKQARYALFNEKDTAVIAYFGEYPSFMEEEKEIQNMSKAFFHQSLLSIHRESQKIISCSGHILEVIDYSKPDEIPVVINQRIISGYKYWGSKDENFVTAQALDPTQIGVKSIYSTSERIYLLYDQNGSELKQGDQRKNDMLLVYDRDCNPLEQFNLDGKIRTFCIDESTNTLYCIKDSPDPQIHVAGLKN